MSKRALGISFVFAMCVSCSRVTQPPVSTPAFSPTASVVLTSPAPLDLSATATPTAAPISLAISATPDFDAPIVTRTKEPPARCPPPDGDLSILFSPEWDRHEDELLAFLGSGGTLAVLQKTFQEMNAGENSPVFGDVRASDVTGDNTPEILVWLGEPLHAPNADIGRLIYGDTKKNVERTSVVIFGCSLGKYVVLYRAAGSYSDDQVMMPSTEDLDTDGVAEILQTGFLFAENGYTLLLSISGWDGQKVTPLITGELGEDYPFFIDGWLSGGRAIVGYGSYALQDIDGNETIEVVISSGFIRGQTCLLLYRETQMILMWSGQGFDGFYLRAPARYRIQAVWDGDHATLHRRFTDALVAYERAIDDKGLLAWSPDYQGLVLPLCACESCTPIPQKPLLDKDELPRLAAYSLYRIVILQVINGDKSKAQAAYDLLQTRYSQGGAGSHYAELAKSFWNEYSANDSIGRACQEAVAYASLHVEQILAPLGRPAYGEAYRTYKPEDICPFQ